MNISPRLLALSLIYVVSAAMAHAGFEPNVKLKTYVIRFETGKTDLDGGGHDIVREAAAASQLISSTLIVLRTQACRDAVNGCDGQKRAQAVSSALREALAGYSAQIRMQTIGDSAPVVTILIYGGRGL